MGPRWLESACSFGNFAPRRIHGVALTELIAWWIRKHQLWETSALLGAQQL